MIDLNNYSQVIYVDAINGDDTIGDGSSNNPYASVIKAVNSATLDNTLIYLKKGVYAIENGLSSTIRTNIELTFFGETVLDRDRKVFFDLQAVYKNYPKMTKQHTYIGIIFKRSNSSSDTRIYEYFNDSSILNIQFKNCVFDVGDVTPSTYIIYTGHSSGCTIVKLEYINCSIIPNNLSSKKDSKNRSGNFINCAIADSDLTTDMPNQLSSTFDYNYELINPSGEYGVYFGEYAWKRYINKTLILHDGKYKKWNEGKEEQGGKNILPLLSNSNENDEMKVYTNRNMYQPAYNVFMGVVGLSRTLYGSGTTSIVFTIELKKIKPIIDKAIIVFYYTRKMELYGVRDSGEIVKLHSSDDITFSDNYSETFNFNNSEPFSKYEIHLEGGANGEIGLRKVELHQKYQPKSPSFWSALYETPTQSQFIEYGMDSLSPLLDRKVTTLEPLPMIDKTSILLGSDSKGKVFGNTVDLKKYFDIRSLKVEVK